MKNLTLIIILFSLQSCQVVDKVKNLISRFQDEQPTTPVAAEFQPVAPPEIEKDKIIQISPRDRMITLLQQFNNSPDETLLQMVLVEFEKNKSVFTQVIDAGLKTEINRAIPSLQQGNTVTLKCMTSLLSFLVGENKDHLRSVLSRAFDSMPLELAQILSKRSDDKICYISSLVPPEIEKEARKNYLQARLNSVIDVKSKSNLEAQTAIFLDQCEKTIRLELNTDGSGNIEPTPPVAP